MSFSMTPSELCVGVFLFVFYLFIFFWHIVVLNAPHQNMQKYSCPTILVFEHELIHRRQAREV